MVLTDETVTALRRLVEKLSHTFDPGGSLCLESDDPDHPDSWASEHMAVIEQLEALLSSPPPSPEPHEVCVCAAIRMPDGYVIRGHRHNDCLRVAAGLRVPTGVHPHDYVRRYSQQEIQAAPQGFYTTRERFVDRSDGLTLQIAAGRKSADAIAGGGPGGFRWQLYSEDLY